MAGTVDRRIRLASDRDRSLDAVFERLNRHEGRVTADVVRDAVRDAGGSRSAAVADRYLTSKEAPRPWNRSEHWPAFGPLPSHFTYDVRDGSYRVRGPYRNGSLGDGRPLRLAVGETLAVDVAVNNTGRSGHGILVKSVDDTEIRGNHLVGNDRGLYVYNALNNTVADNLLLANRVGVHLTAGSVRERVTGNSFVRNGDAVRAVVADAVDPDVRERILAEWDRERLTDVFQQLYLGGDLYRELEGGEPDIDAPGYIHDEPTLVTAETIDRLRDGWAVGVLTGRPGAEAAIALERVGLDLPDDPEVLWTDLKGKVRSQVHDLGGQLLDRAHQGLRFDVVFVRGIREGLNLGCEVRVGSDVLDDAEPALALDNDGLRPVGHGHHLENLRHRPHVVQVFGGQSSGVGLMLGNDADQSIAVDRLPHELERVVGPADLGREALRHGGRGARLAGAPGRGRSGR